MVNSLYQAVCTELSGDKTRTFSSHYHNFSSYQLHSIQSCYSFSYSKTKGEKNSICHCSGRDCWELQENGFFCLVSLNSDNNIYCFPRDKDLMGKCFFLWILIFYGTGSRFTATTPTQIRFILGSMQVSYVQMWSSPSLVLLTLIVELLLFYPATTFKLFFLDLPQVILGCRKASSQCSSHACCISGQKLFSVGHNARFMSAGGLGWSCSLLADGQK